MKLEKFPKYPTILSSSKLLEEPFLKCPIMLFQILSFMQCVIKLFVNVKSKVLKIKCMTNKVIDSHKKEF